MGLLSKIRAWSATKLPRAAEALEAPAINGAARFVTLYGYPTPETFVEKDYLAHNPDIALAVRAGAFKSGRDHFEQFHRSRTHKVPFPQSAAALARMRARKAVRIASILRDDVSIEPDADNVFDALTPQMRAAFGVIDTANVSSNDYGDETTTLIDQMADGLILDCGAGSRSIYYENVVNYEIAKYLSTDVVGVAEVLPFKDNSFDAVFSYAVLEHVKQPFQAAKEISRVLKPGGLLRVIVPFLQPLHGFPSHYFNMTQFGLASLFEQEIEIEEQFVGPYLGPIWTMHTLILAWHQGLPTPLQQGFLDLTLRDLLVHPSKMLQKDFVTNLSKATNFEIASATGLVGRKRAS